MIMMIVLSHLNFLGVGGTLTGRIYPYIDNAYIALDYFFLLSGFGMSLREQTAGYYRPAPGIKGAAGFAWHKVRKLYPLYIITMLVMMPYAIAVLMDDYSPIAVLAITAARIIVCAPLLQTLTGFVQFSHAFNSVCWFYSSLAFLYFVYPWLSRLMRKTKKGRTSSAIRLVILTGLYAVAYIGAKTVESITPFNILSYESPFTRIFVFLIGMELSNIYLQLKQRNFHKCEPGKTLGTVMELAAIAVMTFWWVIRGKAAGIIGKGEASAVALILSDLLVAALTLMVFSFESGVVSKILSRHLPAALGSAAMYIYMIHYPITRYMEALVNYTNPPIGIRWAAVAIIMAATISLSLLIYRKDTLGEECQLL